MPKEIEVPQSCSLIKDGRLTLVVKNAFKETLLKQGISQPHTLIAAHHTTDTHYRGRGLLPAILIQETNGKRMVAKQCMRGGLLRFINKDIFWGGKRPFREMIANAHILKKGIKTTEMLAAAHYKVFGPLYRTYLFSLEIPECIDLTTFLNGLAQKPPRQRFEEKAFLFEAVAQAFVTMHRGGIYHRDLHLKNILIRKDHGEGTPTIFIIDFDKAACKDFLTPKEKLKNLLRFNRSIEKYKLQGGGVTRGDQCRLFKEYFKHNSDLYDLFHKKIKLNSFFLRLRRARWMMGSFRAQRIKDPAS
jgi:serine/threonine protein kinase